MSIVVTGAKTGTYADIARILTDLFGARVTSNQVYMWHQRQARNGFPQPVGRNDGSRNKRQKDAPDFDLEEVLNWRLNYTPGTGGAPRGNTFALRHGRYAGQAPRGKRRVAA
jgi:hypothetical protein